ncbi:DUF6766 family protein [Mycolicibacterium thermoresistibile]|jgi:hypothetical protein|uniref:Uncharacterized protein n=2 Tax=Mycolicibacterium thermoresistibile TaxID=1797 RepID=G7CM41_MYCT3|nr:DUF6766 family protein [Mycolicibacterium thermoresistibile]EHI10994.1 hypothetical protein KEK_20428 [Mycolicibacterium thermoresistibile ATCC 19527]GAT13324.1 uncharacterized protein RMCT_0295 [Mycolicibacterium thermoresistibile]SNW18501.1 Uncharacterised protein [Mycolicibacterium thermoresistibile]
MAHIRRWGAVYILILLFAGSWLGQFFTQLAEFHSTQQQHGQAFEWGEYLVQFWAATLENWQSEWLQLIFQAILLLGAKHWLFRVDAQDLERIETKIDKLVQAGGEPAGATRPVPVTPPPPP